MWVELIEKYKRVLIYQGTSYSLPVTAIMAHGNHHSPIMLGSWLHLSTKPVLFVYSHQILDWNKHFNSRPQAIMFLWVYSLYQWESLTTGLLFMFIIHNHKLSCRRLLIILMCELDCKRDGCRHQQQNPVNYISPDRSVGCTTKLN